MALRAAVAFVAIVCSARHSWCREHATRSDYYALVSALQPYLHYVPVCSPQPITVTLSLSLYMIIDVNEIDESFELSGWYTMVWSDCTLTWQPSHYGNITSFAVAVSEIWAPDLTWWQRIPKVQAFEYRYGIFEGSRVILFWDGTAVVSRQVLMYSFCSLDLQNFPFDMQKCELTFTSWNYVTSQLVITAGAQLPDMSLYQSTGMWNVLQLSTSISNKTYSSGNYTEITFIVTMRREPLFYIFYLMIPGFLISFLGSFVYLLPSEAKEKNAFSLFILLSLTVLLNIMISLTAPKSDIPILSIFFFVLLVLASLACCFGVLMEVIYHTDESRPVPELLRLPFLVLLGKFAFFRGSCMPLESHHDASRQPAGEAFTAGSSANLMHIRKLHSDLSVQPPTQLNESESESPPFEVGEALSCEDTYFVSMFDVGFRDFDMSRNTEPQHDTDNDWYRLGYAVDRLIFLLHITFSLAVMLTFLSISLIAYNTTPQ